MTFGVVLFTLLIQSTTIRPLIRWLRIITYSEAQVEYEMRHARLTALRSADTRLDRLHAEGLMSTPTWERLKKFVIRLACIVHRTDYWRRGRTVDKLGLADLSVSELTRYVNEGIRD